MTEELNAAIQNAAAVLAPLGANVHHVAYAVNQALVYGHAGTLRRLGIVVDAEILRAAGTREQRTGLVLAALRSQAGEG